MYHLTVASGGGPSTGTQYEQLIHKLMEVDGDPNCVLWRHPVLLHVPCTKDGAIPSYFPLTTLPTEALQVGIFTVQYVHIINYLFWLEAKFVDLNFYKTPV